MRWRWRGWIGPEKQSTSFLVEAEDEFEATRAGIETLHGMARGMVFGVYGVKPWSAEELEEAKELMEPQGPLATTAGSILREAAGLVDGPREADHGEKQESFEGIARIWSAYFSNKWRREVFVSALDVVQCQVLMKMTRPQYGAYRADHYTDQCGYSGIAGQLAMAEYETVSGK